MFLHEPGDEKESFSRQDLSSMNIASTQSPTQTNAQPSGQPPPQAPQAIAAASHATDDRRSSRDEGRPPSVTSDGPALPSSASWGSRRAPSRQASQHQSINPSSPLTTSAVIPHQPVHTLEEEPESKIEQVSEPDAPVQTKEAKPQKPVQLRKSPSMLSMFRRTVASDDLKFVFDEDALMADERELCQILPLWCDPRGGAKRRIGQTNVLEQNILRENDNQVASQALSAIATADPDEGTVAGSLQLGGEPEDQGPDLRQRQTDIHPPGIDSVSSPIFGMEQALSPSAVVSNPALSSQQRQNLLQHFKSGTPIASGQGHSHAPQGPSHGRQASRFSFANNDSASTSVHPVASQKLLSQQKNMMPPSHFQQQSSSSQYFPSGVQGPPPGLKTTGTPPVSGGGMFGQGHGFATAGLRYGMNAGGRNAEDEMMRELMRNRGGSAGSGHASDAGRREYLFPSLSQSSTPASHPGLSSFPYGPQSGAYQDHGPPKQKKKGKKHRHANTSSSGGGVVDLVDPSILQARMHQAGAAGNHGVYGAQGQGQGGFNSTYGNGFGGRAW